MQIHPSLHPIECIKTMGYMSNNVPNGSGAKQNPGRLTRSGLLSLFDFRIILLSFLFALISRMFFGLPLSCRKK